MVKFVVLYIIGFDFGFFEFGKVIWLRDVNIIYLKKLCDYVCKFMIMLFWICLFLNVKRGLVVYFELDFLCCYVEEERKVFCLSDVLNLVILFWEILCSKFLVWRRDVMFIRFNVYWL